MSTTRRPFVWWTEHGPAGLLDHLDARIVDAVALPQIAAVRDDGAFAEQARRRGFGLLLDGQAWRAQDEPAFAALPWVDAAAAHAPETWSSRVREDFAEAYIDHQADLATILTTPAHRGDEPARRADLELAALCADHVRARALREPRPGDPHRVRRTLAATLLVRAVDLAPAAIRRAADAYAEVGVDAYVVRADGFGGTEAEGHALLALARALRERTGREVVLAGIGELWQAALAADAAGVIAERSGGVYHGAILGCTDDDVAQRRLFMRHACPCGHHPVGSAPEGAAETLGHNVWWAMREAQQAGLGDAGRAELLLAVRATAAAPRRQRLGITPLPEGWRVLLGDVGAEHPAGDVGETS